MDAAVRGIGPARGDHLAAGDLGAPASRLADRTEDPDVIELARLIRRAHEMG